MCILRDYPEGFKCNSGANGHHVLRRGLGGFDKKVKKHLDHWALKLYICPAHNISRWPDTPEGRGFLLLHMNMVTKGTTRRVVETIPWKTPQPDMTWVALTGEV